MKIINKLILCLLIISLTTIINPAISFSKNTLYLNNGHKIDYDSIWIGMESYVWYIKKLGTIGYPINEVNIKKTFGDEIASSIEKNNRKNSINNKVLSTTYKVPSTTDIKWKSGVPYIKTGVRTWSSIPGREIEVGGDIFTYDFHDYILGKGYLFRNGVIIGTYEKGTYYPNE